MKGSTFVAMALLACTTGYASAHTARGLHTGNQAATPDHRYEHVISPNGPLSREELLKMAPPAAPRMSMRRGAMRVERSSSNTYTYLRCYYSTSDDPTSPSTNYVWATNPSGWGYYTIDGYWYGAGVIANMFYTTTPQATLKSVCQSTLNSQGIYQTPAMYFAADNSMSYNYTVWTEDTTSQGNAINKIVAFGDSLSDNQNMYNESDWLLPNSSSYYIGHFSNGHNWVEYLAQNLNLPVYDWAVGGAGVTTQDWVIPGAVEQVQSWQEYMTEAPNYQAQNTLFTLLIGGNDLVNYNSTVANVMSGEEQAIQTLINSGARNILVLELPDVSKAPVFKIKTNGAQVQAEVVDLRNQLTAYVQGLQAQYGSSLNIQLFDTYSLFNDVMANPSAYGVTNATDSCLDINTDSTLNYMESHSTRAGCSASTVSGYMFWDLLHPTTHTHQVLGNAVTAFVRANYPNIATNGMQQ